MKTLDLFDTIEDQSVQLQPNGVVNMKRIEELTMQRVSAKSEKPARRRSFGVYLLAAVLITLLMATTVFAYVGFTKYENPLELLKTFYGNEEMDSIEGGEVYVEDEYKPYTVVLPTIERVPIDEELVVEVTPPIAAVGQSVSWGDYTLTIVAHQHDKNLGAGTVYYTVENPNGVTGWYTQFNGAVTWSNGEIMYLHGASWENYLIPSETTDTKVSVACYYGKTEYPEKYRYMDYVEMCFYNTEETIQLPKYISDEETIALMSQNGEIVITSLGMEVRIQDMEFLYDHYATDSSGTVYPLPNHANLNYIAVQFSDGSEYVVWQNYRDSSKETIMNTMDSCVYNDPTFGEVATYLFNRVIDPSLVTGVKINDTLYPVDICENASVRFDILPKTNVFNTEDHQHELDEIVITPVNP